MINVLNLYAGIGGNRTCWSGCHVTAVERDPHIAALYQDFFPEDTVVIGDAHAYLLQHYAEYDFIWSSPPCPSHSKMRRMGVDIGQVKPIYPDMSLYQEILLLQYNAGCPWCIENVKPYYRPLILPIQELGRHYFWANFFIPPKCFASERPIKGMAGNTLRKREEAAGISLENYHGKTRKRTLLKNRVPPEIGQWIFEHRNTTQQISFV